MCTIVLFFFFFFFSSRRRHTRCSRDWSSDVCSSDLCERCSVEKNLQRDFRDIKGEFEKLTKGAASVLGQADQLGRATLRLKEIAAMLAVDALKPTLLKPEEVAALTRSLETRRTASIV